MARAPVDAVLAALEEHVHGALRRRRPLDLDRGGHGLRVQHRLDDVLGLRRVGDRRRSPSGWPTGSGCSRKTASVTTARVPKEPISSLPRS